MHVPVAAGSYLSTHRATMESLFPLVPSAASRLGLTFMQDKCSIARALLTCPSRLSCAACCCLQEKEPMGTAGPLALAKELLDDGSGQPFFVLNRYSQQCCSSGHSCKG